MFNRLNQIISRLGDEPKAQDSGPGNASGFQVLRNHNLDFPLEPWFDFIIGINGRTIDNPDPNLFITEIRNCAGSSISLGVWSAKGQRIREIYVNIPSDSASLSVSLQWMHLSVTEDVWHILEVTPNSPADLAGLLPYGDFVIGSPDTIMHGESGLGQWIEENLDQPIKLLVYNHEYDVTRPVEITPSRKWGGQGALGCTLGFGALHRIPSSLEEPPSAPGETMFAASTSFDEKRPRSVSPAPGAAAPFNNINQGDFLIPANLPVSPPPPKGGSPAPPTGAKRERKNRAHHTLSPGTSGLDQYFEEQEQQSRQSDHQSASAKSAAGVPPPPKSGGPPKAQSPAPPTAE